VIVGSKRYSSIKGEIRAAWEHQTDDKLWLRETVYKMASHKALVIDRIGHSPILITRPTPEPKEDELLVKTSIVGCKQRRFLLYIK
jgi:hypothetical protein